LYVTGERKVNDRKVKEKNPYFMENQIKTSCSVHFLIFFAEVDGPASSWSSSANASSL
jgi:hypothetical protein